jgi:hypothetical protein
MKKDKKKTKGISFFTMDCTVQPTIKGLKRKRKRKKRHTPQVNFFFYHKKYIKKLRSKSVRSLCKDITESLGSSCNT